MSEAWLKCDVIKGMFSDELVVKVRERNGDEASFFVPKSKVEGAIDQVGRVRVRVFHSAKSAWAVIPADDSPSIPVNDSDLIAA